MKAMPIPTFNIPAAKTSATVENTPPTIVPDAAPPAFEGTFPDMSNFIPPTAAPAQAVGVVQNTYLAAGVVVNPFAPSKRSFVEAKPETDQEREKRLYLLDLIERGESYHPTFNREFNRYVLNAPPPENLVTIKRDIPGKTGAKEDTANVKKGENIYITIQFLWSMLDSVFESWSMSEPKFTSFVAKNAKGVEKELMICSMILTVVYPLTGLTRTFIGCADSQLTQNTASNALLSNVAKNAISKIGRYFGRDLWIDESGVNEFDKLDKEVKSFTKKLKNE